MQNDPISDGGEEEDTLSSTKSDFHEIRIVDNVNPDFRQSYFKVKINENIKGRGRIRTQIGPFSDSLKKHIIQCRISRGIFFCRFGTFLTVGAWLYPRPSEPHFLAFFSIFYQYIS